MNVQVDSAFDVRTIQPKAVETSRGIVEYAEFGRGPAVLCVHGAMGGYDQSLLLAQVVGPAGYRYIGVSRPGYLGTPLSSGRAAGEQAALHAALLDALGIERAIVMAVSGGGYSSIQFAIDHPSRCAGLVLASTTGDTAENRIPVAFKFMSLLMRLPAFNAWAAHRNEQDPLASASRSITDPAWLERTVANPEAWSLLQQLQRSTLDRAARRMPGTMNDIAVTRRTTYRLEAINAPTLVLHGTHDPLLPIDRHGRALARRIPGAELFEMVGGEHAAIFSHREEARERVGAFLGRLGARE